MNEYDHDSTDGEGDDIEPASKTQLKKEAQALQELAVHLTTLNAEQLARVPLTPALEQAIAEAKNIKKNEALRRHYQFLGRLMRSADHEAIAAAVAELKGQQDRLARLFHAMENWRDSLIGGEQETVERFIAAFPQTDRQQLNQLVRSAKGAAGTQQAVTHARKLFRFIRAVVTAEQNY
jgi:ribosome-associated protein